tara:strand:- start:6679 stop:8133 length:1455 start_codon:yes stop_codon:yes gene_type:complete
MNIIINKKFSFRIVLFLFLILCNFNLRAQNNNSFSDSPSQQIEIIIFEYLDHNSSGNEVFNKIEENYQLEKEIPNNQNQEDTSIEVGLLTSEFKEVSISLVPTARQIALKISQRKSLNMSAIYNRLNRLRVYEPVIWGGWEQRLTNEQNAFPVNLRSIKNTLGKFDGNIKFYESSGGRLRLSVDIEMYEKIEIFANESDGELHEQIINTYKISNDKEMRYDELRYFDHPKFGLIAKIQKQEPSELIQKLTEVNINPESGNIFDVLDEKRDDKYVSSIDRGIVGLSKSGQFISLTLQRNGDFTTNISDQLKIDELNENEIGIDKFFFEINDGRKSSKKEIDIQIIGINDAPTSENRILNIESNDTHSYSFNIDDFVFNDVEGSQLDHILITNISENISLSEEYDFASWPVQEDMIIKKKEIGNLKAFLDHDNLNTASFSFKVNDGEKNSEDEYTFEFNYDDSNEDSDEVFEELYLYKQITPPDQL